MTDTATKETTMTTKRIDWARVTTTALGVLAGTVAAAGTLAVAVAGFTLSFDAIKAVGRASYITVTLAWMLPVSIDGAMAVATVAAVVLQRAGRSNWYPWAVVSAGAGISVLCNALHAYMHGGKIQLDEQPAMAVSAIPAVMLALSVHLLVELVDTAAGLVRARHGVAPVVATPAASGAATVAGAAVATPVATGVDTKVATGVAVSVDTRPATPVASENANGPATVSASSVATVATSESSAKLPESAMKIARLRGRRPEITQAEVAKRLELSERTVSRYWSATVPRADHIPAIGPVQAAKEATG